MTTMKILFYAGIFISLIINGMACAVYFFHPSNPEFNTSFLGFGCVLGTISSLGFLLFSPAVANGRIFDSISKLEEDRRKYQELNDDLENEKIEWADKKLEVLKEKELIADAVLKINSAPTLQNPIA